MRLLLTLAAMALVTAGAAALVLVELLAQLLPLVIVAGAVLLVVRFAGRRSHPKCSARTMPRGGARPVDYAAVPRARSEFHGRLGPGGVVGEVAWLVIPVWGGAPSPRRQVIDAEVINDRVGRD